jgi:hypothetical protein
MFLGPVSRFQLGMDLCGQRRPVGPRSVAAMEIDAEMMSDRVQPGGKLAVTWLPLVCTFPDSQKRFLYQIFCIVTVSQHANSKPVEGCEMTVQQFLESALITLLDLQHQFCIIGFGLATDG